MHIHDRIYLGGRWVPSQGSGVLEVVESASEEVLATVPQGSAADVDVAVTAAVDAFPAWSALPPGARADWLDRIADGVQARSGQLAELIAREVGMPLRMAAAIQVGLPLATFRSMAALAREYPFEEQVGASLVVREPVGVVGAITPWNYPLHQIAAKVASALAAGCTVVLKPSEVAPLNAFALADIADDAGLPPGVLNLVSGTGPVVGEALVTHPGVDMISFTGSTRAGRRVQELAAAGVKRVALELGGKSPNVLLDDADLPTAVPDGVKKAFLNSGQTCSALTRMVVPRTRLAEVEDLARAAAESLAVGDPLVGRVFLGPLVSHAQRERVRGYIRTGQAEGARLITGGAEPPDGLDTGFYLRPTVFSDVSPGMTIAQEEIFGPVLVIQPHDGDDDAVRIANDTVYGLAAGVWSADPARARAVARRIRAGQIEINGAAFNPAAPFGGYKQSGIGREFGRFGLEEFLEVKSLQL